MKNFIYYAPTKVYFGNGRSREAGKICAENGFRRVLIVYGSRSAERSGLIDRVEASLREQGIVCERAGGVVANPVVSRAREIIRQGLAFGPDLILGVGGGSVIDTAKAVSYGIACPDTDVLDFFRGTPIPAALPHACILTISAAGSEMSDSAVLTDDVSGNPVKYGNGTPFNRCRFAILDPELTYTLPKFQIGAGAADIFMHTAERYFVPPEMTGNYASDAIAEAILRNIIHFGPIGYANPQDPVAMSEIMWTSTLSHNDISGLGTTAEGGRGGDWAVHQFGQAMSALYDSTHGASLSAVWSVWANYCYDANPGRFVQYGKNVWGLTGNDEEIIRNAILKTDEWFTSLGQPTDIHTLLGFEPDEAVIEKLAMVCSRNRSRTIGKLKVLDYDDMIRIYQLAK